MSYVHSNITHVLLRNKVSDTVTYFKSFSSFQNRGSFVERGFEEESFNKSKMEPSKSKKIPAFFKPFVAEYMEQRLLIPQFFSKFMKDRMPYIAFIRDRKEKIWNVEIFGQTACEKEFSVEAFEAQVKEEDEDSEDHDYKEGEDKEMDEEDEHDGNYRAEMDEDGYSEDDQDEIVELRDANKRKRNNKKDKSCNGGRGNNAKSTKDLADDIIFDLGIVDRPKNPYFVGKLDPKRKSDLRVPTDVIRDFNLKLPERIDIFDEEGRTWSVVVKEWNDGRICLTKGWRAFWKWNAVKPNDKCLCEFVPGKCGSKIQLTIRIFREASLLQ
ncbi:hypothetical protein POM88_002211 [Heracleum sosnowskyi]|uniref:TF-B3 domain-containing protein n=1 Tax=Heracleum sosnowskyi TaxID=360622 RepID=A0AAD8JF75_9APIA|nr:hypothetical protein POM88_002211 [Heracleum sosnowskyi]